MLNYQRVIIWTHFGQGFQASHLLGPNFQQNRWEALAELTPSAIPSIKGQIAGALASQCGTSYLTEDFIIYYVYIYILYIFIYCIYWIVRLIWIIENMQTSMHKCRAMYIYIYKYIHVHNKFQYNYIYLCLQTSYVQLHMYIYIYIYIHTYAYVTCICICIYNGY